MNENAVEFGNDKNPYELGTAVRYNGEKLFVGGKCVYRGRWWYNLVRNLGDVESVAVVNEDEIWKIIITDFS